MLSAGPSGPPFAPYERQKASKLGRSRNEGIPEVRNLLDLGSFGKASHTIQSWGTGGKYPPAKPGALGLEPLKAAWGPLTRPGPSFQSPAAKEYLACRGPGNAQHPFPTPT